MKKPSLFVVLSLVLIAIAVAVAVAAPTSACQMDTSWSPGHESAGTAQTMAPIAATSEPTCLEVCNAEYKQCRSMAYSIEAILACSDARAVCVSGCGSASESSN